LYNGSYPIKINYRKIVLSLNGLMIFLMHSFGLIAEVKLERAVPMTKQEEQLAWQWHEQLECVAKCTFPDDICIWHTT